MERSQPRTPLLAEDHAQTQVRRSSSPYTIPRKPIPRANAEQIPEALKTVNDQEKRFHSVVNSTSDLWPTLPSLSSQPNAAHQRDGKHAWMSRERKHSPAMTGRLRHITFVCVFLVLPLCGITTALLVVVYQNRLPHSYFSGSEPCSGLVVDYGASQLTSLSTWISTIATILAPAFMALLSYPIAKSMTQRNETEHSLKTLPSPYQTGLLIELLGGSLISLWSSLTYIISPRRARVSPLLYFSYAGLVCGVLFGVLTQLADFWLHRATHSILYTVPRPLNAESYGRQLSPYCQNYYDTNAASQASCTGVLINGSALNPPCSVVCGEYEFQPRRLDQGFLLANSLPASSSLAVTNVSGETAVDGPRTVVALLPSGVDANVTWSATTVGVSTQCEYLSDKCETRVDPEGAFFSCGPDVPPTAYNNSEPLPFNSSNPGGSGGFFGYILSTLLPGPRDDSHLDTLKNPWTFALAMRMTAVVKGYDVPDDLPTGTESIFTIVMCNATTYDVEYSVGNQDHNTNASASSALVTVKSLKRSSSNVHNTVQGHILHAEPNAKEYIPRAMLASIFAPRTADEKTVLPRFEEEYGKVALSFAAPSFEGMPTTQRNIVEQKVVSCVQRAPLWSLIGLVAIYILLAFILTIVAIVASADNNVRSAQSQLSVAGLAAKAFDEKGLQHLHQSVTSMQDLFEERNSKEYLGDKEEFPQRKVNAKRVGFRVNDAGRWEYDVLTQQ